MKAEVVLSPSEISRHDLVGKIAVVIDVFRFTTTILTALEAGFDSFLPVKTVEEAFQEQQLDPQIFLAGERQALRIDGFDFGNSPLEYYGNRYEGGKLVCSTTNGTNAIIASQEAKKVVLASLRSAKAVARYLKEQDEDVVLIPAGLDGKFSLEDTWCAGLILSNLPITDWGDGATIARLSYENIPLAELKNSTHGKRLQELKLDDDLEFCLECDKSSGVILWNSSTHWGSLVSN